MDILPVYAVQQEQEQDQTDESKAEQAATFNTTSSLFYPITGILLDTSPISTSSKNQRTINDNSSELALHNGLTLKEFQVPLGSRPHDVVPSLSDNDVVWYTAQALGELGKLNASTGKTHHISLGQGSAPHGVIVGPDGAHGLLMAV